MLPHLIQSQSTYQFLSLYKPRQSAPKRNSDALNTNVFELCNTKLLLPNQLATPKRTYPSLNHPSKFRCYLYATSKLN